MSNPSLMHQTAGIAWERQDSQGAADRGRISARRWAWGLAVILAVPVLAACQPSTEPEYGEPVMQPTASPVSGLPDSPITDRLTDCMREAGWEVTRSWTGGIDGPELPSEQVTTFQAALTQCQDESGWNDLTTLSPDQIDALYEQEVEAHECLRTLDIASNTPPSLQKYRDSYGSADQYYAILPGFDQLNQAEMQKATAACPPPTWFMNLEGL